MGAPIVHWEINTRDPNRVLEFYRSLFGWQISMINEINYGMVKTGSKRGIGGGIGQTEGEDPNLVTFYVEVDDPQQALDKAISMGAGVVVPVTEIPNMVTFAQFKDPDGNIIGLIKSVKQPSTRRVKTGKKGRKKAPTAKRKRRAR